jgi:hypothetical protein
MVQLFAWHITGYDDTIHYIVGCIGGDLDPRLFE